MRLAEEAARRSPNAVRRVHVEGGYPGKPDYDAGSITKRDWPVFLILALVPGPARDERFLEAYLKRTKRIESRNWRMILPPST